MRNAKWNRVRGERGQVLHTADPEISFFVSPSDLKGLWAVTRSLETSDRVFQKEVALEESFRAAKATAEFLASLIANDLLRSRN